MTQPMISVIVPVYNLEKHLERTMALLLAQTYPHLEIILVDDGSTDATPAICDRLAAQDDRILVLHTENQGVSAARNAGLKAARGEYIGFCDGDDLPEKDMFAYLYGLISAAGADIAVCGITIRYEDGSCRDKVIGCDALLTSPQEALGKLLGMEINIGVYTKLFRAELLRGLRFPEDIRLREDEYFCYAAFCRARRVICGAEAKYCYLRHSTSSTMAGFSEKYFDILKVCNRLEQEVCARFPQLKPHLAAKRLRDMIHLYKLMVLRKAGAPYKARRNALCESIRQTPWSPVSHYLSRNDRFRFGMMKCSRHLYRLVVKAYDKH